MNAPSASPRRVLVVDDNENIHRDFRAILTGSASSDVALAAAEQALFGDTTVVVRTGFELDFAYQGHEALAMVVQALAEGRPYAMAFVDMRIPPGWDGLETIARLWEQDENLQIAICSAYSDYSWNDLASRLDLRDRLLILKKPFDNVEIYQLATALTAKWQLARESDARLGTLEAAVAQRTFELRSALDTLQEEMHQRQQLQSQLALRQRLDSIGQLAAGIAHEINTPIQYIGDSLHFLRSACAELCAMHDRLAPLLTLELRDAPSQQIQAAAQAAVNSADVNYLAREAPLACERALGGIERVSRIVSAMRRLTSPTSEEFELGDLNEALQSALVMAAAEYKHVATVETQLGELPPLLCNIGELGQVFLNLIVNAAHALDAAKHDATTGRITVRTWLDTEHVVVSIGDNGAGIAASIAGKIFDPFFTTKAVGKGTGQGLALAHTIVVTNHAGTLTFDTIENEGTTFYVRLPIAGAKERRAEAPPLVAAS